MNSKKKIERIYTDNEYQQYLIMPITTEFQYFHVHKAYKNKVKTYYFFTQISRDSKLLERAKITILRSCSLQISYCMFDIEMVRYSYLSIS